MHVPCYRYSAASGVFDGTFAAIDAPDRIDRARQRDIQKLAPINKAQVGSDHVYVDWVFFETIDLDLELDRSDICLMCTGLGGMR
jgi:hypothetical protein